MTSFISTDFVVGFQEPKLVNLMNIVGVRVKVKWRSIYRTWAWFQGLGT